MLKHSNTRNIRRKCLGAKTLLASTALALALAGMPSAAVAREPLPVVAIARIIQQGSLSDLVQLEANKAELQQTDRGGNTLLHVAGAFGNLPAAAWLQEQGLDANRKNNNGQSAADLAQARGHLLLALFLRGETPQASAANTPNPAAPTKIDAPELSYRRWTSSNDDAVEAAFILLDREQVHLKTRDGHQVIIPMPRLSWRDQIIARRLAGQPTTMTLSASRRKATIGRRESDAQAIAAFGEECESLLIAAIDDAKHEILIAIYTITNQNIVDALVHAANRKVNIHIKYDGGQLKAGRMEEVLEILDKQPTIQTTPIEMSGRFASMHHKFAVIDQIYVFTGSFNFTVTAATRSYENAVLLHAANIADLFTEEFENISGNPNK